MLYYISIIILLFVYFCVTVIEDVPVSNEAGFLYLFSIIIDTFIIRPIIVPALLSIGGKYSDILTFWPTKMPTSNLRNEYGVMLTLPVSDATNKE